MNNDGKLSSLEKLLYIYFLYIYIYIERESIHSLHPFGNCQKPLGTCFKVKQGSKLDNGTQFLACYVLALKVITTRTLQNIFNDSNIK